MYITGTHTGDSANFIPPIPLTFENSTFTDSMKYTLALNLKTLQVDHGFLWEENGSIIAEFPVTHPLSTPSSGGQGRDREDTNFVRLKNSVVAYLEYAGLPKGSTCDKNKSLPSSQAYLLT